MFKCLTHSSVYHGNACVNIALYERGKSILNVLELTKLGFTLNLLHQLVIRVHMSDESSKTMMVDERQTVRQVLDSLLDKSHCGYSPDWALVETIPELQMGEDACTCLDDL